MCLGVIGDHLKDLHVFQCCRTSNDYLEFLARFLHVVLAPARAEIILQQNKAPVHFSQQNARGIGRKEPIP